LSPIIAAHIYGLIQPPTVLDEHRPSDVPPHLNLKVCMMREFGLSPRSIHANPQPRTHSIVVSPSGALTTISKLGCDVCALAAIHPIPTKVVAIAIRRLARII
jgi:hypothetical protein